VSGIFINTYKILLCKLAGTSRFLYQRVERKIILKLLLNNFVQDSGMDSTGSGAFLKMAKNL